MSPKATSRTLSRCHSWVGTPRTLSGIKKPHPTLPRSQSVREVSSNNQLFLPNFSNQEETKALLCTHDKKLSNALKHKAQHSKVLGSSQKSTLTTTAQKTSAQKATQPSCPQRAPHTQKKIHKFATFCARYLGFLGGVGTVAATLSLVGLYSIPYVGHAALISTIAVGVCFLIVSLWQNHAAARKERSALVAQGNEIYENIVNDICAQYGIKTHKSNCEKFPLIFREIGSLTRNEVYYSNPQKLLDKYEVLFRAACSETQLRIRNNVIEIFYKKEWHSTELDGRGTKNDEMRGPKLIEIFKNYLKRCPGHSLYDMLSEIKPLTYAAIKEDLIWGYMMHPYLTNINFSDPRNKPLISYIKGRLSDFLLIFSQDTPN